MYRVDERIDLFNLGIWGVFFLLVWNVLDVFYLMKCIRIVCGYNWNCVWCVLCFEVV